MISTLTANMPTWYTDNLPQDILEKSVISFGAASIYHAGITLACAFTLKEAFIVGPVFGLVAALATIIQGLVHPLFVKVLGQNRLTNLLGLIVPLLLGKQIMNLTFFLMLGKTLSSFSIHSLLTVCGLFINHLTNFIFNREGLTTGNRSLIYLHTL